MPDSLREIENRAADRLHRLRRTLFLILVLLLALPLLTVGGCGDGNGGGDSPSTASDGSEPVTAEPVDPSVARRLRDQEASASHILIAHADSKDGPEGITRTRQEAENMARQIALKARQGADFAELARKYSDDPKAQVSGGYLGIFVRGEMLLDFEVPLFAMDVGQVGVVIETEYGFHVLKRHPVRRVVAHHLLIAWREGRNVSGGVTRTREQARLLAEEVWRQATAPGADLCDLVQAYTDDPNNRTRCGDLGVIEPGILPVSIDQVLFRLREGEISEVVETEFGYHIIWREEVPAAGIGDQVEAGTRAPGP